MILLVKNTTELWAVTTVFLLCLVTLQASEVMAGREFNLKRSEFSDTALKADTRHIDATEFLERKGFSISSSPGSKAIYIPQSEKIVIRAHHFLMKQIEYELFTSPEEKKKIAAHKAAIEKFRNSLSSVRIPKVSTKDWPLKKFAEWLKTETLKCHNIEIDAKDSYPNDDLISNRSTITLDLHDVPLLKLLEFYSALTNSRYELTPDKIILYY